jgi:hypothetical protein
MKRLFVFLLAGAIIFYTSSCKKIIAAVYGGSDITVPELQIILPQVYFVQPNELWLGSYAFTLNLDSIVKANTGGAFGANSVNSVKIKQVTIKIINPDAFDNLANIDSARVTLQSSSNTTPIDLFHIGFDSTYADTYVYTTTNSPELLPYLKGNILTYSIYGKLRSATNKPLGLVLDVTLRAD